MKHAPVPRHNSPKYNRIYRWNPLQSILGEHKFKPDYRPRTEQESQDKMKIQIHSQPNCCCPLTTFQCDHSKSGCTFKVGQFRFNNFLIHKVFGSRTRCVVAPNEKLKLGSAPLSLVTNNGINLPPGLLKRSPLLFSTWPRKLPNNCAEWKIYLKLIYRETHLNLFLIRIKIQLLVISFAISWLGL